MSEKIREEISKIERMISWKQEELHLTMEEFRRKATAYATNDDWSDSYQVVTFMPGSIEQIANIRNNIQGLTDRKNMLEYLLKQ